MTSLVPQAQASALDGAADLESVIKTLANRKVKSVSERPSKAPKIVPVTQTQRDAISRLNDDLSSTTLPLTRRLLNETELAQTLALASDAKLAIKAATVAVDHVKTAVFNHLDIGLETDNDASDLPSDAKGHYLVDGEIIVGDTGQRFTRETRQASPALTEAGLKQLLNDGKITRAAYMRMTQHVEAPRVLNEDGLLAELKRNPELLEVIAEVIEPGQVTSSFWVRDVKKED